jgi:hypothetical protein
MPARRPEVEDGNSRIANECGLFELLTGERRDHDRHDRARAVRRGVADGKLEAALGEPPRVVEMPTSQGDSGPRSEQMPARDGSMEPLHDRFERVQLRLGRVDVAALDERVEPPEVPPELGIAVAVSPAQLEHLGGELESLGVAIRCRTGQLPRPQGREQRAFVPEPAGHRDGLGTRGLHPFGLVFQRPGQRQLGEQPGAQCAVARREAFERSAGPGLDARHPARLGDLVQGERGPSETLRVARPQCEVGGRGAAEHRGSDVVRQVRGASGVGQQGATMG